MLGSVGVLILIIAAGLFSWHKLQTHPAIPSEIRKQLTFVPFTNTNSEVASVLSEVKYDKKIKLLTYTVFLNGVKVVVSQQATPESFNDVPQAYDALLQKMYSKNSFDSVVGKVNITYPEELKGLQTAVMNSKGVLLFAKPESNISVDEWKKFFNNLSINE